MAISIVQCQIGLNGVGTPAAIVTTATTGGNAGVVLITTFGSANANHSITGGGGTWTKLGGIDNATANEQISIWVNFTMSATTLALSIAGGTGTGAMTAFFYEVAGITTFTAGESSFTTAGSSTSVSTGAVTNATAASIFFALDVIDISGTHTNIPNTPFTFFNANSSESNGSTQLPAYSPTFIASTSASTTCSWSGLAGSNHTLGLVALHGSGGSLTSSLTENVTSTDTPSATQTEPSALTENASATDTPSASQTEPASLTETVTATDTPSAALFLTASLTETVTATDTPSAIQTQGSTVVEVVVVTDTPSASQLEPASLTENANATDTTDATLIGNLVGAIIENVTVFDTVSAVLIGGPTGPKKGWPFADDLSIPPASYIPRFDHNRDEEDIRTILAAWLQIK